MFYFTFWLQYFVGEYHFYYHPTSEMNYQTPLITLLDDCDIIEKSTTCDTFIVLFITYNGTRLNFFCQHRITTVKQMDIFEL